MSTLVIIFWLANLVADTVGQLGFKAASRRAEHIEGLAHWQALFTDPIMWIALAAFVSEFALWLALLSLVPLSTGVMIGCINIVGVMIGGHYLFGEKITRARLSAILLIAVGVGLVGWGGA